MVLSHFLVNWVWFHTDLMIFLLSRTAEWLSQVIGEEDGNQSDDLSGRQEDVSEMIGKILSVTRDNCKKHC